MFASLGAYDLMFLAGAAIVGFGAVKFMLHASAEKKREAARKREQGQASADPDDGPR